MYGNGSAEKPWKSNGHAFSRQDMDMFNSRASIEMKYMKGKVGVTKSARIRNEVIRAELIQETISHTAYSHQLSWGRDASRMRDSRLATRIKRKECTRITCKKYKKHKKGKAS